MTEIVLPRTTREFLEVPVTLNGEPVTDFEVCILPLGQMPSDGNWRDPDEIEGLRGLLVGPDDGGSYAVWTRVIRGQQRLVRRAGGVTLSPGDDDIIPLALVEGEPFAAEVRVPNGATLWPDSRIFYANVRRGPGYPVLLDLQPFLKPREDDADLIVRVEMTGADTRAIAEKLDGANAQYDAFIGETGNNEARAVKIIRTSPVTIERSVTGPPA